MVGDDVVVNLDGGLVGRFDVDFGLKVIAGCVTSDGLSKVD